MDMLKMAMLDLTVTLGMREIVRMKADLAKEKNDLMRAGRERLIRNTEVSMQIILDELHTLKTDNLFNSTIKVGGTD